MLYINDQIIIKLFEILNYDSLLLLFILTLKYESKK